MTIRWLLAGALLSAGCGTTTLDAPEATSEATSEASELGRVQHQLASRLEQTFGKGARVQQVFGKGKEVLLGVALQETVADSDVRAPLALAAWRQDEDSLSVLDARAEYKEARKLQSGLVLVTTDGELRLRGPDDRERTLASDMKGEVSDAPGGALVATREAATERGNSAVLLVDATGGTKVLADAEGVDDRPSVSPDNKTVLFVSGRTGVASFWRTTLDGAAPVQLTNKDIQVGVERDGPPEGFVPPPVTADAVEWVSKHVVRYDAGGGELWTLDVRTGAASRVGGDK